MMRLGRQTRLYLILVGLFPILLFSQNSSFSFVYDGPSEIILGEDCMATLSWGHPNTPTAISNLPNGEILSFEILSISGGYSIGDPLPPGELVTILYQAIDNFNNTAIFGFSISVVDNTPPTFDEGTLPPDIEVACVGDIPTPPDVMGFDNCVDSENLFVTFTEEGNADLCAGGVITRTWVIDDDFQNFSTYSQTITVLPDTTKPTITVVPQDDSGACENAMAIYSNWIEAQRALFTADDDGCGNVIYTDNGPDPSIFVSFCGDIPVLFTASDDCGNSTSITATFSLTNSIPPTITTQASDASASCDMGNPAATFQSWISNHGGAEAFDDCGSVVWTTNPENPTLQDTCAASRIIEFIVDDGCGNTSSTVATFTMIDTTGPTISNEAQNRIVTCSSSDVDTELGNWLSNFGNATAMDLCTNPEDITVEYLIGGMPFDSLGVFGVLQDSIETGCKDGIIIGGIIFNDMLALLEVEFLFKDRCGNGTGTSALFGLLEGLPPAIVQPAENMILACDSSTTLEDAFLLWYNTAGGAIAEDDCGAVAWRGEPTYEAAFDLLSAALDTACGTDAVVEVSFFASDFCGLEVDTPTVASFGLVDTLPPILISNANDLLFECDTVISITLNNWLDSLAGAEATDDCANLTWYFRYVTQQGDTISGMPGLGPYPEAGSLNCSEPNTFTFIAADFCGNEVTSTAQFILIDTIPPVIVLDMDSLAVSCSEIPGPDDLMVTDNCPGGEITIMAIDSVLSDTATLDCAGFIILREWIAIDECGNTAYDTLYLLVSDEVAPTFIIPADTILTCQALDSLNTGEPTQIEDNCDLSPTVLFSDSISFSGCDQIIFRTWVIIDDCGNMSSDIQQISLVDTISPIILACVDSLVVPLDIDTCVGTAMIEAPIAEDDCSPDDSLIYRLSLDGNPSITLDSNESVTHIFSGGTHSAEWEITDCSGNSSTCMTIIVVEDLIEPVVVCAQDIEIDIVDSCAQIVMIPAPVTISDNCIATNLELSMIVEGATQIDRFTVSVEADFVPVLLNIGTSTVSFIVTDPFANADTCMLDVVMRDAISPVALCQDFEIDINPSGFTDHLILFEDIDGGSSDNCNLDTFRITPSTISCMEIGSTRSVQMIVVDEAGNPDTCQANVTVNGPAFTPSFAVNICDVDTLLLFANAPDSDGDPYTFSWTGPGGFTSTMSNPMITGVDSTNAGTYVVEVSGQTGCRIIDSVTVNINSMNVPVLSAKEMMVCLGDTIYLNATEYAEEVVYEWYEGTFPNGLLIDTSFIPELQIASATSGAISYYLLVSSDDCMIGPSDSISVVVNDVPDAMIDDLDVSICSGDTIRLQSFNASEGVTYFWNGPSSFTSDMQNPVPFEGKPALSGEYELFVVQNGCMSDTQSVNVTVFARPEQPVIAGQDLYCNGGVLVLVDTVTVASDSLVWLGPGGDRFTTMNDTLIIDQIGQSVSGSWQVIAFSNGCPSDTSQSFIVTLELTTDLVALNSGPVCLGDDITISISEQINGAIYSWSGPNEFSSDSSSNLISPAIEGLYELSVLTLGGCELMLSTEVQVINPPVIDTITVDFENCVDGNDPGQLIPQITSQGVDSIVFSWTSPSLTSMDSIFVLDSLTADDNGIYFLTVSESGCVSETDSVAVQVLNTPLQPVIFGEMTHCSGDSLTLIAQGVYPENAIYQWITPEGNTMIVGQPQLILADVEENASGAYILSVEVDGCASIPSDTFLVEVIASISSPQIMTSSRVCEGDSIFLAVEGGPVSNGIYYWTGPSGFSATTNEPFIFPATDLAQGNYFVELQIGPCRSASSDAFFIEVVPRPKTPLIETDFSGICLDAPMPIQLCIVDSTLSAGATYTWSNAGSGVNLATTQAKCFELSDFSSFAAGSNSIFVETQVNGCTSFSSAVVSFQAYQYPQETAIIGDDQFICVGETPIVTAESVELGEGLWTSPGELLVFQNEQAFSTEVLGLQEGMNTVIWTLSYEACVNFSADTSQIIVEPFPSLTNDTIIVDFGQTANFNVVFNDLVPVGYALNVVSLPGKGNTLHRNDGDFVYTPNIGYVGEDRFSYEICSDNCPDQCETAIVLLRVGDDSDCFVPTIFTPNSDGVNDRLIIPCLEAERFPNNRVLIFNQWGDEVYQATPYRNDWDGTRKGKDLPVATYYFIVDFGDGSEIRKGFLVLER